MADYLSVAAKLVLNVHDLNNEGSVGQSLDIRQIRMVDENGSPLPEMPAVSGRMMKHWHLAHMLTQELTKGAEAKLCDQCEVWEPERKPQDENNGIKACVICDTHGFLCTDKPGFTAIAEVSDNDLFLKREASEDKPEERIEVIACPHKEFDENCPTCALRNLQDKKVKVTGEFSEEEGVKSIKVSFIQSGRGKAKIEKGISPKGLSLRRASCVNFSWLLPVLGQSDQGEMLVPQAKQVIHSRVAPAAGSDEEKSSQMIFYKSYASGIYAFVAYIDLGRIGKPLRGEGITNHEEIERRQKLAVQSLLPIVTGAFGASQSHALPHARCLGLLAALSTAERPVPNLISPIYSKGFEESIALLKALGDGVSWWTFGEGLEDAKGNVQEVFDEILEKL